MNQNNSEFEIDLRELFSVVVKKLWLIIIAAIIGGMALGLYAYYTAVPVYSATAKMYILTNQSSIVSLTDLQIGSSLAGDYQEIVRTRYVAEKVNEELGLNMNIESLRNSISIYNPSNTRFIYISCTMDDPYLAMQVANKYIEVSSERIAEIMKVEKPMMAEEALVPTSSSGTGAKRKAMLGAMGTAFVVCAIIIIRYLFNDTVATPDDIERYLGLNVLASIPKEGGTDNSEKTGRKNNKKRHGVRRADV